MVSDPCPLVPGNTCYENRVGFFLACRLLRTGGVLAYLVSQLHLYVCMYVNNGMNEARKLQDAKAAGKMFT